MLADGASLIAGEVATAATRTFTACDARSGAHVPPTFHVATDVHVDAAVRSAAEAAPAFASAPKATVGRLLREISSRLLAGEREILARADIETGLGATRLASELRRTTRQLELFAELAEEGSWVDARIHRGQPDVRSMRVPRGPVAVFGAGNFPLAFSVAGGDTASALAARCPVVVKAHPDHPGTAQIVALHIVGALDALGLPQGLFSLLMDDSHVIGQRLVQHPAIRAVAFTGSRRAGMALVELAARRADPVPVFAEMSSTNPVLVLGGAARAGRSALGQVLSGAVLGSAGQLCTKPGLILLPVGPHGDEVRNGLVEKLESAQVVPMLSQRIRTSYEEGLRRISRTFATRLAPSSSFAAAWEVSMSQLRAEPQLSEELFGPSTVIARYSDVGELMAYVGGMEGQLTATVHASDVEVLEHQALMVALASRCGRLVFNGVPTGAEVCDAMVHGGPFPATYDGASTSVGLRAVERFTRLLAFQDCPARALPPELQDDNPTGIVRRVDGKWEPGVHAGSAEEMAPASRAASRASVRTVRPCPSRSSP